MKTSPRYQKIYARVRQIPEGQVATYGQIANLIGLPRGARQVGYALNSLTEGSDVPWHRVVNAKGEISLRSEPGCETIQRQLLEAEGITFDVHGRIDLEEHRWHEGTLSE